MQREVIYLDYEISAGQRTLGQARKEAICHTPRPQTVKELRTFLRMTGCCRLGFIIVDYLLNHYMY